MLRRLNSDGAALLELKNNHAIIRSDLEKVRGVQWGDGMFH